MRRKAHPCIVIAASGMCSGGRIVNYLKALHGEPAAQRALRAKLEELGILVD